jgi:hypothetical protein
MIVDGNPALPLPGINWLPGFRGNEGLLRTELLQLVFDKCYPAWLAAVEIMAAIEISRHAVGLGQKRWKNGFSS